MGDGGARDSVIAQGFGRPLGDKVRRSRRLGLKAFERLSVAGQERNRLAQHAAVRPGALPSRAALTT